MAAGRGQAPPPRPACLLVTLADPRTQAEKLLLLLLTMRPSQPPPLYCGGLSLCARPNCAVAAGTPAPRVRAGGDPRPAYRRLRPLRGQSGSGLWPDFMSATAFGGAPGGLAALIAPPASVSAAGAMLASLALRSPASTSAASAPCGAWACASRPAPPRRARPRPPFAPPNASALPVKFCLRSPKSVGASVLLPSRSTKIWDPSYRQNFTGLGLLVRIIGA